MKTVALLSLLHESRRRCDSARRLFRARPVLSWTLARLQRCSAIKDVTVICWEEQLPAVTAALRAMKAGEVHVLSKPRQPLPAMEAVSASRRWADGWRGGLLGACCFDAGFHAPWALEAAERLAADAVLLVDPSAALLDPKLVDDLLAHAAKHEAEEFIFAPATPGLATALVRRTLLQRLAASQAHPGHLLSYRPGHWGRDPINFNGCAPVPPALARTPHALLADSDRQVRRLEAACADLNGALISSGGEEILRRLSHSSNTAALPREVTVELTARRCTRPIYSPLRHLPDLGRPDACREPLATLFAELAEWDDVRVSLGGVGDPLLHPQWPQIVADARAAGIDSVHIETDLAGIGPAEAEQLANCGADVVSVFISAATPATYERMMGADSLAAVMENLKRLLLARSQGRATLPLVVPTFVKCQENLAEMEAWYDHWLGALHCAVIVGPGDCAGLIPSAAVADMSPPGRVACRRLGSRMTVLSDGRVVPCEEDVLGRATVGAMGRQPLRQLWSEGLGRLRDKHAGGEWNEIELCAGCREWHRP